MNYNDLNTLEKIKDQILEDYGCNAQQENILDIFIRKIAEEYSISYD